MSGLVCEISKEEVARAVANHQGVDFKSVLSSFQYSINPASKDPLGFLGEHVRIVIDYEGKQLQYFGKKIPTKAAAHREYAEKSKAFYKEIELYKTLFDDMQNALSPARRQLKWRPNCYFTRDWDLVIVEDLSLQGFYMLKDRSLLDFEHMKGAMKAMARMHAGSIIFEEKLKAGQCTTHSTREGTTIRDLYPNLIFESECTDIPGHPGFAFWETGIKSQCGLIDLLPGYTVEQKDKIKRTFPVTVRQVYRMLEPSNKFRNVMLHADLWGNNVLFRKGPDGEVSDAMYVDFQMARYAPPAQDVLSLLHIAQNKPFRDAHEADILELYYAALKEELSAEGLNVEKLISPAEYEESCKFYKRYAGLNQMIFTQLNLTPPELCGKFFATSEGYKRVMYEDRTDVLKESFLTDEFCRDRVTEAMQEIIEMFELA